MKYGLKSHYLLHYFLFLGGRGGPQSPNGPFCLVHGIDNLGDLPVIRELDSPPRCPEILPITGGAP